MNSRQKIFNIIAVVIFLFAGIISFDSQYNTYTLILVIIATIMLGISFIPSEHQQT
jgi:uncharacterized membrane-anchored protein YitT (DUF2179 family)